MIAAIKNLTCCAQVNGLPGGAVSVQAGNVAAGVLWVALGVATGDAVCPGACVMSGVAGEAAAGLEGLGTGVVTGVGGDVAAGVDGTAVVMGVNGVEVVTGVAGAGVLMGLEGAEVVTGVDGDGVFTGEGVQGL